MEKMQYAEYPSIVWFVCVRMAIVANQLRDAQDPNVQSIMIVKLINSVRAVHAEIHVCSPVHAVSTHNAESLIDRSNAHALPVTLEIRPLNARSRQMHALAIHAAPTQDVILYMAATNARAHQDVSAIHTKDAFAVSQARFVRNNHVDEMQHAELIAEINPNVTVHH